MWVVLRGVDRGIYGCKPSETARQVGTGQANTATAAPTGANVVHGDITADGHFHQVSGGGIYLDRYQPHQPMVLFHALAHGGHYCGPQQGPCPPPPV